MDRFSDAEITAEIRYPQHDLDDPPKHRAPSGAQRRYRDNPYPAPTLSIISRETWGSIVAVTIVPLLLALLFAIHPWTFRAAAAGQADVGQFPTAGVVSQDDFTESDTDADTGADTASAAPPGPADEAAAVTAILRQAQTVRQSVVQAVRDASTCGDLADDQQALSDAESARDSLAMSAADTPVDALPGAAEVPEELSTALSDSAAADDHFAHWVGDVESSCDSATVTDDSEYRQGEDESQQASDDKQTVLATWNSVAARYGQPTFSESDI